ncbi:MAG: GAF domain-containing protein [Chloroflexota bacterium]|nr:GAF domain-containing protein [Chloroflexota bacterium]
MKTEHKVIAASILFGLFVWVTHAVLDCLFFYEVSFLELLITDVPAHEIYVRLTTMVCVLVFGVLVSGFVAKRERAEDLLRIQRDLAIALSSTGELTETLDLLLEITFQIEGVDSGGVYLVDGLTGELSLAAHRGLPPPLVESASRFAADSSQAHLVMAGAPIYRRYSEVLLGTKDKARQRKGLRGIAIVPAKCEGRIVAALSLTSHTHDEIPISSRNVLETIAAQIGAIISRLTTEAALRASEALYHSTIDTMDPIHVVDADLRFTLFNAAFAQWCEELGMDTMDVIGRTVFEIFPFLPDRARDEYCRVLETGKVLITEEMVGIEGREFFTETRKVPVWEDGGVTHVVTIVRDITERQRTEKALREQREELQLILDTMPATIWFKDTENRFIRVNEAAAKSVGMSVEDIEGETAYRLFPKEADHYYKDDLEVIHSGEPKLGIVEPLRTASGEKRWVRTDKVPCHDEQGNVTGVIVFALDITERVQAEEDLLQHAERQTALYAVALAATTMLDPDELLSAVLDTVLSALNTDAGWVTMIHPAHGIPPRVVAWRGVPESFMEALSSRDVQIETRLDTDYFSLPPGVLVIANLHSHVGIPLRAGDEVLGILNVAWRAPRLYPESDLALLIAIGRQVGLALRNAQLYQDARQADRLQVLNAISGAAVSSLEMEIALGQVLDLTCQTLDAAAGSILVSKPDTGELTFVLTRTDEGGDLRGQHLSPGQGVAGWVAQHGRSVRVDDVRSDPRWYDGVDAASGFETRSLLCAPLKHHGKITGVIEVLNKKAKEGEGAFTSDDLSLLEAVSFVAAAALENARLYATTREHAAEMALLNEIGLALTSTLNPSAVVRAALSHIQRLFQAEYVSLLQPDPQTGELCFTQTLGEGPPVEISICLPEDIAELTLEQGQPVLLKDALSDPRFLDWVNQHFGGRARALMVAPLLTREHTIGMIEVASDEPGAYTYNELSILRAIASTLAVALENANLYDELKALLHEWEEAQAQLIHAEKMTAMGRLISSIAHEINNPLQAVQTYLTLTQEELNGDRHHEQMARYLTTVEDEIERIATIVCRMRDFYRPAREGLQSTDLHAVLESVLALTNKQLQHSDVVVARDWAEALPAIQTNPDHLKQVFLNLVLNGIDAMPAGGTLYISTALMGQMQTCELPSTSEGGLPAVRVEFSDTGKGMPPEVLSRIFEPFFTTKDRGTGLGLSISYGIIQSHGGQITVESRVGLGTTFTILLPVNQT